MDHDTTDRKTLRFGAVLVGIFIVLLIITNAMSARYPAPQPHFYYPDPTPFVVETQRIEILSNNRLCIGASVQC